MNFLYYNNSGQKQKLDFESEGIIGILSGGACQVPERGPDQSHHKCNLI